MAHPNYHLFENNCQNFAKFLIDAITPGSLTPETIQNVLERWQTVPTPYKRSFPGTYPTSHSTQTTDSETFITAAEVISITDETRSGQDRTPTSAWLKTIWSRLRIAGRNGSGEHCGDTEVFLNTPFDQKLPEVTLLLLGPIWPHSSF